MEGHSFGISLRLFLLPSLVLQGLKLIARRWGGWLCVSTPCSGLFWDEAALMTRQAGEAETCLDNLVVLENKVVLTCSAVSVVGLSKSDLEDTFS